MFHLFMLVQLDVKATKKAILDGRDLFFRFRLLNMVCLICHLMYLIVFAGFRKTDESLLQESSAGTSTFNLWQLVTFRI